MADLSPYLERKLAECKGGASLSFNDQLVNYETAAVEIERRGLGADDFVGGSETRAECIARNRLLVWQWYPDTPNGFFLLCHWDLAGLNAGVESWFRARDPEPPTAELGAPAGTFTEPQIREALKRLPFQFESEKTFLSKETDEPHPTLRGMQAQLRMRQMVEYDLADPRLEGMPKEQREMNGQVRLRDDLAHHMAELVIACLRGDTETIYKYAAPGSEMTGNA